MNQWNSYLYTQEKGEEREGDETSQNEVRDKDNIVSPRAGKIGLARQKKYRIWAQKFKSVFNSNIFSLSPMRADPKIIK